MCVCLSVCLCVCLCVCLSVCRVTQVSSVTLTGQLTVNTFRVILATTSCSTVSCLLSFTCFSFMLVCQFIQSKSSSCEPLYSKLPLVFHVCHSCLSFSSFIAAVNPLYCKLLLVFHMFLIPACLSVHSE